MGLLGDGLGLGDEFLDLGRCRRQRLRLSGPVLGILGQSLEFGGACLQALAMRARRARQRAIALGRFHRTRGQLLRDAQDPPGIIGGPADDQRLLVGAFGQVARGAGDLLGRGGHLLGGGGDLLGHRGSVSRGAMNGARERAKRSHHVLHASAQRRPQQYRIRLEEFARREVALRDPGGNPFRREERPDHGLVRPARQDDLHDDCDSHKGQEVGKDVADGRGAGGLPQDRGHHDGQQKHNEAAGGVQAEPEAS